MTFVLLLDKAQPPRCRVCVYSRALCPDGPQKDAQLGSGRCAGGVKREQHHHCACVHQQSHEWIDQILIRAHLKSIMRMVQSREEQLFTPFFQTNDVIKRE